MGDKCQRHAQEQVVLYQKLARVSVYLAQVFFWYKFLARNSTLLYSSTIPVGACM